MSRLLYLTALLISITCCSILSSTTAEDTKFVQLGMDKTVELGKSRDIRGAGNRKKVENRQNGGGGKRQKNKRNGSKKKVSRKPKDRKGGSKRQNERKGNNSLKRRRQRLKQKKKSGQKKNRREKDRKRNEKRKKKERNQRRNNGKDDNAKDSRQNQDTCIEKLNALLDLGIRKWKFTYQKGYRAKRNNEITWNKFKKRALFYRPFYYLLRALGGSLSSPKCKDKEIKDTIETQHLTTLEKCEINLKTACTPLMIPSDENVMVDCSAKYNAFNTLVYSLIKKETNAADVCRDAIAFPSKNDPQFTEIETCSDKMDLSDEATVKLRKACFEEFKICRQAERQVAKMELKCRSAIYPPTVVRWVEMTIAIKTGNIRAKTTSIQRPPGTTGWAWKQGGETVGSVCSAILDSWKAFNVSAVAATASVEGPTDMKAVDQALLALESIDARPKLEEELFACENEVDTRASVFEEISSYSNWASTWNDDVVTPKIEYLSTITTTTPIVTTTTPIVTTTTPIVTTTTMSTSTPPSTSTSTDVISTTTVDERVFPVQLGRKNGQWEKN